LCPEGFVGLTEGLPVPEIAASVDEFPAPDIAEALVEPERVEEAGSFEPAEPDAVNSDSKREAPTPSG
jgi:hypothetical protein